MNEARSDGSPADEAQLVFAHLVEQSVLMNFDDPEQSEADTRAKLIDPIFKQVLGWSETDIRREEPASDGFADYSFGQGFKWFHVEAKRAVPRFMLFAKSKARKLKLSGPHLLGNRGMKDLIEQAAKYAPDLGTQFAILTNGTQFILFEATPRGKSWRSGYALVWHDHDDIRTHFAEFFYLLARENVESGVLNEKFAETVSTREKSYVPLDSISNPDVELVRNSFWNKIAQAFSPLLIDQPENNALQEEIVKHCYVSTALAHESSTNLGKLLRDIMPVFIRDSGARHIDPDDRGPKSFRVRLVDDLKVSKPGSYILTGGVGSGKTSFLRRFAAVDNHPYIRDFCVWLHIDYLPYGGDPNDVSIRDLEEYTYQKIMDVLKEKYPDHVPTTGEHIRETFETEINDLGLTLLYGVDQHSPEYHREVNKLVDTLRRDTQAFLHAVLRRIRKRGKSIVFVLDNTDQQGERFQKLVFLLSQKLSDIYSTLSIVSLRKEKFFAAYRQGVFDAYGTRKFHIGSPELIDVIKKRLNYGLDRYARIAEAEGLSASERRETQTVVKTLIESSTVTNSNIIRFLACVSSGDMRLALLMFSNFMSSGNTDTKKIMTIVTSQHEQYLMPFHEFAKSAILGSRRYYRGSVSKILNVFAPSSAKGASLWTACRVLSRLLSSQHVQSVHGEGFVHTSDLLREYRESFGFAEDFVETSERLMIEGLLESEPPRVSRLRDTETLRITATGAYYWSFLVRSFAYLDLVLVDTPCYDERLARELASLSEMTKEDHTLKAYIAIRFKRVGLFPDHIAGLDKAEVERSREQGGPYDQLLSEVIKAQIEKELCLIRERTGA